MDSCGYNDQLGEEGKRFLILTRSFSWSVGMWLRDKNESRSIICVCVSHIHFLSIWLLSSLKHNPWDQKLGVEKNSSLEESNSSPKHLGKSPERIFPLVLCKINSSIQVVFNVPQSYSNWKAVYHFRESCYGALFHITAMGSSSSVTLVC